MQKKGFSIVVTDNSSAHARAMRDYISEHSEYGIAGLASDGLSALKLIDECNPDLLVLDMMLPMYDGCEILEHIRNNAATAKAKIIITSAIKIDYLMRKCEQFNINYFFRKPFSYDVLLKRIDEILHEDEKEVSSSKLERQLMQAISLLRKMNFKPSLIGYRYLIEAFRITLQSPDSVYVVSEHVYPFIAQKFETTIYSVERNIRSSIEVAWERCDVNILEELFGYTIDYNKGKPTNKEFIAMITDKITVNGRNIE